jgi:hypothetical protein
MQKPFTYRISSDNAMPQWRSTWREALKLQRVLYKEGAERVEIAKEYLR